jgi:hypothetical protein
MAAQTLYDQDFLTWTEQQADLLERLAAGERVNDFVDWPHVIEELRDLGASQVRACRSWLELACLHLLKMAAWPDDDAARIWRVEVENFKAQFAQHYIRSMRQKIDIDVLYAAALAEARSSGWPNPRPLPDVCPFTIDDFTSPRTTTAALLARLNPPA